MSIMTRVGRAALERIARDGKFVRGLHSIGELDPERRFIMHFPEELSIESFGSGYGGNALLGKKCHALRIASYQARTEGWLAEHMLIVGLQNPQGETHYVACAFPSACGKTNLAMLIPPDSMPGWKVFTVGDDIAWLHPGTDGRLWAINPEAGYFGVVPGTNPKTNRNAYDMIRHDTFFTNVAVTADNQPWWEGLSDGQAGHWIGRAALTIRSSGPAAHPNSRFTVSAKRQSRLIRRAREDARRRADQRHRVRRPAPRGGAARLSGPRAGSTACWSAPRVASETTAAAVGRRRRRAPRPDGDAALLRLQLRRLLGSTGSTSARSSNRRRDLSRQLVPPGRAGKFLWPGFSDNLRVLRVDHRSLQGNAEARETADRAVCRAPRTWIPRGSMWPRAEGLLSEPSVEGSRICGYSRVGARMPASCSRNSKAVEAA